MSALLDPMPSEHGDPISAPPLARGLISLVPPAEQRDKLPTRPGLTDREIEVLLCWIRLDSKTDVARALFLSLGTVNTHLTRIRAKYTSVGRSAPTKAALVARALQDGLVDISEL
ncbi:LuxR family transcriptional regulator [Rhodococcoides fascians]|uniref:response regulator transcription factor n=1 Tax=Rhodococcoides fascians TaxID=1828 RepID=UPI000B9AC9FC|nr:LuxR C-terminal-related transcriptional regulator [Rhodococcus fascians]OZE90529.1 LuxR family transcriptional regulator [Rhodococcus fascians]OZF19325.1 LuxR family transcriptional regulator [Rhodococcus fascians]OZF22646.1 LuxR family transcriptional regulator [Rhodococcus fascians]OZF68238.1 LuxR family transcriptional regulator [Rhodococcus fascians]OZF71618.1 LuxR family transcriptional regulator [Rhodococcus fascians]